MYDLKYIINHYLAMNLRLPKNNLYISLHM